MVKVEGDGTRERPWQLEDAKRDIGVPDVP